MISGNVPQHLNVAARTGFLTAAAAAPAPWRAIAEELNMTASSQQLVDLGGAPMPTQQTVAQDFIEKTKSVTPSDWSLTVWLSHNAMMDDQTGDLNRRVQAAGNNFQKHISNRVFTVLNAGDSTTYGLCYDGQDFFDSDHVDKGGEYQTAQDNENVVALSDANFETVWVAAQQFRDDQGEFTGFNYDLIVCHPSLYRVAANIASNPLNYATGNNEQNPFSGMLKPPLTSAQLDTSAWHLIASSETIKPLIVGMREQPNLQSSWFDPEAEDGGRYYFKFYARYEVVYGDWRLASQGQT